MLNFLALFFPSVRKLIELKNEQDVKINNVLDELGELKKTIAVKEDVKYVILNPVDYRTKDMVERIGSLWVDSNALKYLFYTIKREIVEEIIKNKDAVKLQNQLIGIEKIVKVFEGYAKQYEQLQIQQH